MDHAAGVFFRFFRGAVDMSAFVFLFAGGFIQKSVGRMVSWTIVK